MKFDQEWILLGRNGEFIGYKIQCLGTFNTQVLLLKSVCSIISLIVLTKETKIVTLQIQYICECLDYP